MARVHTAYLCDICGAGLVALPGQPNDWESINTSALFWQSDAVYNTDDWFDLEVCGKCAIKIRGFIVSLQRDGSNAS